jgi:hypothetical protein
MKKLNKENMLELLIKEETKKALKEADLTRDQLNADSINTRTGEVARQLVQMVLEKIANEVDGLEDELGRHYGINVSRDLLERKILVKLVNMLK